MKTIKRIPHPTQRCDYLDLYSETAALTHYTAWTIDCLKAAAACGDTERQGFYKGLAKAASQDNNKVFRELEVLANKLFPPNPSSTSKAPKLRSSVLAQETAAANTPALDMEVDSLQWRDRRLDVS